MRVKFWGTRGSIPTPEPSSMKYGGDTSCVEIRSGSTLIILDAGTGIRRLGASLMKDPSFSGTGYIFLSHSHWDHIQGFPFFAPAFVPGNEFFIHGAFKADKRLQDALRGQMGSIYFPISMQDLPSSFHFGELLEQDIMAGDLMVRSRALNHPGGCFGYRITDGKHTVAYCTDTEPHPDRVDEKVLELARDADVFIYDAQFTPEEYASDKRGWGHSTWQEGIKLAHEANARRLVLFHHDPWHDDRLLDAVVQEARVFFPATVGATRDLDIDLGSATVDDTSSLLRELSRSTAPIARVPGGTSDLRVVARRLNDALVVTAPRDLSVFNSEAFQTQVTGHVDPAVIRRLVLDMVELSFIDSSGIGSLAAVNDSCRRQGIEMSVCNVSSQIHEVLRVTRIHLIMPIFHTVDDAVRGSPRIS